jgi:hypothetical protein
MDVWKKINSGQYFKDIEFPNWETVEDFTDWYINSKMPFMIPWDASVLMTDDATALCLFKKPPYQVELYLIHPKKVVPEHCHPGLEVITMFLDGGKLTKSDKFNMGQNWGLLSKKITNDEPHGGTTSTQFSNGYCLLAFQKWPNDTEITSASIHWKGYTAGPIHEKLIQKYHPNAVSADGFADVTR